MQSLRPNERRAKHAIIWIQVIIALELLSLVSKYLQCDMLLAAGDRMVTQDRLETNVLRELIIDFTLFSAGIVSIITFIRWFRRAYFNLHQLVPKLSYSEGWAAGSWFVPIVCLYAPYRIMKDLYTEIKVLLGDRQTIGPELSVPRLNVWWLIWLLSFVVAIFAGSPDWEKGTIDELKTTTLGGMVSMAISIVLGILTIDIVKRYSQAEQLLTESLANDIA